MDSLIIVAIFLVVALFVEWIVRRFKVDGKNEGRYVLITGCDSGFGHLAARRLDALKFKVFACCLLKSSCEKLEQECSDNLVAVEMDVREEKSVENAKEIVKRKLPKDRGLWAVINNAGVLGTLGSVVWATRQEFEHTLAVNTYGAMAVTRAFLPLVRTERGRIVNTSSIAGRMAFPLPTYTVSKYALEAYSDLLRRELYRSGVKVSIIEPGGFKTPIVAEDAFLAAARSKVASLPANVQSQLPADIIHKLTANFIAKDAGSPNLDLVVDAYLQAITAKYPKARYIVGRDANLLWRVMWTLPEWVSDYILDKMIWCMDYPLPE